MLQTIFFHTDNIVFPKWLSKTILQINLKLNNRCFYAGLVIFPFYQWCLKLLALTNIQLPKKGSAVKGNLTLATSENNVTKVKHAAQIKKSADVQTILPLKETTWQSMNSQPNIQHSDAHQYSVSTFQKDAKHITGMQVRERQRRTDWQWVIYGASSCSRRVRLLFSSSPSLSSLPDVSHPPWETDTEIHITSGCE